MWSRENIINRFSPGCCTVFAPRIWALHGCCWQIVLLLLVCQYSESKCDPSNKKSAMSALCTNKAWLIWWNKVLAETLRQLRRGGTTSPVPLDGFRLIYTDGRVQLALFYFSWCLSNKNRKIILCRNSMMDGLIKWHSGDKRVFVYLFLKRCLYYHEPMVAISSVLTMYSEIVYA